MTLDFLRTHCLFCRLNVKQKKFAEAYHLRGNATEAYLSVYGGESDSARANGARLLAIDSVSQYVKELQAQAKAQFTVTRGEMLKLFYTIATAEGIEETRDRISAGKEVCRIMGFYEAEKLKISADDDVKAMLQAITGAKTKAEK